VIRKGPTRRGQSTFFQHAPIAYFFTIMAKELSNSLANSVKIQTSFGIRTTSFEFSLVERLRIFTFYVPVTWFLFPRSTRRNRRGFLFCEGFWNINGFFPVHVLAKKWGTLSRIVVPKETRSIIDPLPLRKPRCISDFSHDKSKTKTSLSGAIKRQVLAITRQWFKANLHKRWLQFLK